MNVAIIGGGAAGFFSAITVKENYPSATVTILEKAKKVLAKVKISGGGRCNLTNGSHSISELCKAYPRGGKFLKKHFHTFSNKDTIEWFELRGVPLVIQSDNCVFPKSQDSQSIIDCFLREAKRLNVLIETNKEVKSINAVDNQLQIHFSNEEISSRLFDKVIVTTGGSPKPEGLKWLEEIGHNIEQPVPSLFSFNIPNNSITKLMGIVADSVQTCIQGTKIKSDGTLLITHWGMSGPAILKLSSFGARLLNENDYKFSLQINWANEQNNDIVFEYLNSVVSDNPLKMLGNVRPFGLSERLWLYLLEKLDQPKTKKWGELGKKGINKIVSILTNDIYEVNGKSTHAEEFVTCGGVSLHSIDQNTLQSKHCKNLYFAGEVLDIDAITGGYNLQGAWTTGFVAGKLM
jgi:predicted Rossmann fold flavoprotein